MVSPQEVSCGARILVLVLVLTPNLLLLVLILLKAGESVKQDRAMGISRMELQHLSLQERSRLPYHHPKAD